MSLEILIVELITICNIFFWNVCYTILSDVTNKDKFVHLSPTSALNENLKLIIIVNYEAILYSHILFVYCTLCKDCFHLSNFMFYVYKNM